MKTAVDAAGSAQAAGAVLSRELTAFLVEFSVTLHKHAIYPSGHPSLGPAASRLANLAGKLLQDRTTLAFGVARHQLIIDGVATDPKHPVLRRLAESLHQHELGALSILPGVESEEFDGALRALSEDAVPNATEAPERPPDWPHIRFHPLTLERLELIDDEGGGGVPDADSELARRRGQLWVGLANAALAQDVALEPLDSSHTDPLTVAKAIDDRAGAAAYDQVIIGYLLQIADELKSAPGADHGALRRRTARLIRALRPETLQRLVTMGGNSAQRRAFVVGATSGMAMDSVVKILRAAADASGQTISHGLVRMLSKLATHAEGGREHARPVAQGELREQVDQLLSGWDLANPSPDEYVKTLQHLATTRGPQEGAPVESSDFDVNPMHVVQTCLEVGGVGPIVERAIDRAIAAGHAHSLYTMLSFLPPGARETADVVRRKLSGPKSMAALVAREPVDLKTLDALMPSLTIEGYEVLLDALINSESRGSRRKLLERLAPTHLDTAAIARLITARLYDAPWYVQRNLLLLLERLRAVPDDFSVTPWTQHDDPRVRYHGFSLQLNLPDQRDEAIRTALSDTDERINRLALASCQDGFPRALTPTIAGLAANQAASQELRLYAVRALGTCRDRYALDTLVRLVQGGTSWLGKPKLAPRTPVVLAALRVLAGVWKGEAPVGDVLDLARRSSDPELRQAVHEVGA